MTTETLLQVLFANGHESLVALAVRIDNNIDIDTPKFVTIEVTNSDLPSGKVFDTTGRDSYNSKRGYVQCEVIASNKYKLSDNLTIVLPNGTFRNVSLPSSKNTSLTPIIDKVEEVTKSVEE